MSLLQTMITVPLVGVALGLLVPSKAGRNALSTLLFTALTIGSVLLFGRVGETWVLPNMAFGYPITFQVTWLSAFFVFMIGVASFVTSVYSYLFMAKAKGDRQYYTWLFLKTFGMFGVVLAHDLLTFFIFWEVMGWSTYFLMVHGGGKSVRSAYKYLVYAISSGMLLLAAVAMAQAQFGGFGYDAVHAGFAALSAGKLLLFVVLFTVPFAIESALFPLHSWLPDAYADTFTPLTSYLSGISTRVGVYGIILLFFYWVGLGTLDRLTLVGHLNFRYVFGWFAALTMVIPTFTAMYQYNAKRMLAWHSVGQGGYMLIGLASGSALGIAGGMFHILNHMLYVMLIVFSAGAVQYRTGTVNMNKLGGLIKKQPVAFLGLLVGIIGLAGMPPLNGFVSKWFIYKALILGRYPFLAMAAFIGTVGTILSVYKLIHDFFLGQLPKELEEVREVPFALQASIWILMIACVTLGVAPGLALRWIAKIQIEAGLPAVPWSMNGIAASAGQLNMLVVMLTFVGGLIAAGILFLLGHRRRHIHQYNNYAAGHFLDETIPYNFNYRFYPAFEHIFNPLRKQIILRTERVIADFIAAMGEWLRRVYTGNINTYAAYVLVVLLVAILVFKEQL